MNKIKQEMGFETFLYPERKMTIPHFDQTYEDVCEELEQLSLRLQSLLPDPSIGPEERLERMARVIPQSIQYSNYHKTARTKLNYLKRRLNELVPDLSNNPSLQLEYMLSRTDELYGAQEEKLFKKLEAIEDNRISDIGR